MLKTGNLKEIESSLRDYVAKGDYSKPFVIAGWIGSGKSVIMNNIFGPFHWKASTLRGIFDGVSRNRQGGVSKYVNFQFWTPLLLKRGMPELLNLLSTGIETSIPVIIEITTYYEEGLTPIVEAGFDVYNVEFDRDLWFEWAEKIDTEIGRRNVPMRYIKFLKESPAEYLHFLSGSDPEPKWGRPNPEDWARIGANERSILEDRSLLQEQIVNSLYVDGDLDEILLNKALNEVSDEKWNEWVEFFGDSVIHDNQAMSRAALFFAVIDKEELNKMGSVVSNAYKEYCKKN